MRAANERQTTKKEKTRNAANARWSKQNKDDATIYGTIVPAANMNWSLMHRVKVVVVVVMVVMMPPAAA